MNPTPQRIKIGRWVIAENCGGDLRLEHQAFDSITVGHEIQVARADVPDLIRAIKELGFKEAPRSDDAERTGRNRVLAAVDLLVGTVEIAAYRLEHPYLAGLRRQARLVREAARGVSGFGFEMLAQEPAAPERY